MQLELLCDVESSRAGMEQIDAQPRSQDLFPGLREEALGTKLIDALSLADHPCTQKS